MESSGNKHDIQDDWIVKLLECPECFNIPRELPIPQCPAGHIVCRSCKDSVQSNCPTCRRRMYHDGTSSLAASLIEKVPHKCKYSFYGCEVKDLLAPLKIHEEKCVERTIKCLSCRCEAVVQLKKFEEHVKENKCCTELNGTSFVWRLSTGFMQWDGLSKKKGAEFNLSFERRDLIYTGSVFIFIKYYPKLKTLVFAVITPKDPEEAEHFSAKISMQKGAFKTFFECPLISIEQFPPEEDFPNDERCWNIHYSFFRKFLHFEDKGENNNHDWEVTLTWSVHIHEKKDK